MLIFTHDKNKLAEHFRRDPVLFAYHNGDLDDFFFDKCQWLATYHKSMKIDEVILVYNGTRLPTVLAFGLSERFTDLLSSAIDLLPSQCYCHFFEKYRGILCGLYAEEHIAGSLKMKLDRDYFQPVEQTDLDICRLSESDQSSLEQLYLESYPENYFEPRMLETGKYFGCFIDDALVAASGVHVYSPSGKVAALGNIATATLYRGRGLATAVTSVLVKELIEEDCLVMLNVKVDNVAAIKCYQRLGFQKTHEYHESLFTRKK